MSRLLLVHEFQGSATAHADSLGACRVVHIDRPNVEALASRAFGCWCARVRLGRGWSQASDRSAEVARPQQEVAQAILANMIEATFRLATVRDVSRSAFRALYRERRDSHYRDLGSSGAERLPPNW